MFYYRFIDSAVIRNVRRHIYLRYEKGEICFTWTVNRMGGGYVPKEVHKLFNEYISNPFYEIDFKRFMEKMK